MSPYNETYSLSEIFGPDLILADEHNQEEHYRIVREMEINEQHYAVLQRHGDPDEDAYLFRVIPNGEDIWVEDVEDDDEWDRVTDVCRQMIHEQ